MKKNLIIIIIAATSLTALFLLKDVIFPEKELILDQANKTFLVNGDVKIKKAVEGAEWIDMDTSTILEKGDIIQGAEGSSVDIIIGENAGKVVKIREKSHVEFKGVNPGYLNCSEGKVLVTLKNLEPNSSFRIRTPMGISGARGTGWSVEVAPDKTTVCVFENDVFAYGVNAVGKQRGKELIIDEGARRVFRRDKPVGGVEGISDKDSVYWKRWSKSIAYLREGKVLINDFDRKENFNNLDGACGSWNVFYGDPTQFCRDELTDKDRFGDAGYSMKLTYDVDSENSSYNGFFTKLLDIDLSDYKYLVFYIKGDSEAGFTTSVNIELKNKYQIGRTILHGITDKWQRIVVPLNRFMGIGILKNMKELVIVFSDIGVTKKEGVLYLDEIYFSKTEPADKP